VARLVLGLSAAAVLFAGCGAEQSGGGDGTADTSDAKEPATAPRTVPHPAAPLTPSVTPSPTHTPLPAETSVPDPALPPPVVSMDIAHAAENGGKGKAAVITIDDGPDPVWTPQVLSVLKDNGVKATFCMIGPQATAHPDLVRRVVAAGHRLCDHTVDHDERMDHKSHAYQKKQILDAATQIAHASGGVMPMYYRAPGGAFTPYSRQIAAAAGLRPLGWNVDSTDWERPGSQAIQATVKGELGNGSTILFHDGGGNRSETVAALRQLLPWLRHHGYAFRFPVR
jgi:peptidoglycan/xylan/chitin deacetylase (PgdA/CDA1 family)